MSSQNNENEYIKKKFFYPTKILLECIEDLDKELNEILKDNMNKEYFNDINSFLNTISDYKKSLNNKITVEEMIINEVKEFLDYVVVVKEDIDKKNTLVKNTINKYIDFEYELIKDILNILNSFSKINISMYKKYKNDLCFKIMSLDNAVNLSSINIMANIEFLEDVKRKKEIEDNHNTIINRFKDIYNAYK